jgi:predicted acyltransferase
MILVNNPGDWGRTFPPLLHAEWHGWTPTDLIFPFFLFVLGVAIPLAFAARMERSGGDRRPLYRQIAQRTAILLGLGLALAWFPFYDVNWATARFPGVLQRIAVVYLLASLAFLRLDVVKRVWLSVGLLLGYWIAMELFPVPGSGAGDLSPDGNLAAWLDSQVFGRHVWRGSPGPGDPEGLLSTFPATVTALAGVFTGEWLRSARDRSDQLIGLFVWGSIAAAAGCAWGWVFPVNKNLWTSSYVVLTAGLALVTLAVIFYFVDVRGKTSWAEPFVVFGTNAITVFVLSGLVAKLLYKIRWTGADGVTVTLKKWLYTHLFSSWIPDYFASLAWAGATIVIWWALMRALHKRKIYIKI